MGAGRVESFSINDSDAVRKFCRVRPRRTTGLLVRRGRTLLCLLAEFALPMDLLSIIHGQHFGKIEHIRR